MKTVFYRFVILAGLSSCKSVSKMVEKGEYDKAFNYAISNVQGEKNKKTEYAKALEKAYSKINSATLREIEKLNPEVKPENWSRVLSLYTTIENRQEDLDTTINSLSVRSILRKGISICLLLYWLLMSLRT